MDHSLPWHERYKWRTINGLALLLAAVAIACSGCATAPTAPPPPAVPEPLVFTGTLDLSGQGVGFVITHASGLSCTGRYGSGRLPDPVSVEVTCNDEQTGTLTVTKTAGMRGDVTLSDGRQGIVTFAQPPQPVVSTRHSTAREVYVRHGRGGCGSRGGPGYRLPNGKCASWRHRR